MLQEASKLIESVFHDSFIKRLCLYLHDCVREEVKSATFKNLTQDKDNKWHFLDEKGDEEMPNLLYNPDGPLGLDGTNSAITELMLQAEIAQKDRYLLYSYLFLKGKDSKRRKNQEFLTPLLYVPCKLERSGLNISCTLGDENLSLNTGALTELIKFDDEDEVEHLFEGLVNAIPELPLTDEKVQIFLTTLKSIVPDIEIDDMTKEGLYVEKTSAIILTKRPTVTAGVLHELTQMSEMPYGMFRETSLSVVQEEYNHNNGAKPSSPVPPGRNEKFYAVTPLESSTSQEKVISYSTQYPLTTVYGPPGTGKSQTIVNLVSHLVASGKTVLVVSRMDKAVDVVHDRLNRLGAPFLCLRAGRSNYQKNLNIQLQDLLADKIDLDTDFEESVLADVEDVKHAIKESTALQKKCETILEMEKEWSEAYKKYCTQKEGTEKIDMSPQCLNFDEYRTLLDKIERSFYKTGFINSAFTAIYKMKVKKGLKLKDTDINQDNMEDIRLNLILKEMQKELKVIESSINRTGNLQEMLEDLRVLRKKQKQLAVDTLKSKRRESLKDLIRDHFKRQRLIIHSKALVERKKNLQNRLLQDEDFSPLLAAFPCWAVTTYEISDALPLKPGLFDVVIIDEASQCDIASCFPALFRGKRAVIVGDDKQLHHLSFLEKAKEQSFLSQYNIADRYQLIWRFRTNSVFDLATFYSARPVMLDEHFRSHPAIINFSNEQFYGGKIRIMKKDSDFNNTVELSVIEEAKVDLDSTRNMPEAEKIMERLQEIIISERNEKGKKPSSIGIISPFRGQVELLKKAASQVLSEETIRRHKIEIGTAHTFQGDEKDIILLSLTLAPNSHFQSITFAQRPNLFNVAVTRAKKQLLCYISRPVESLPSGLIRSYLEYVSTLQEKSRMEKEDNYNNWLEEEVSTMLRQNGLRTVTGYESAGFKIDLAVFHEDKSAAIEFDGVDISEKTDKRIWKQTVLERCGWNVVRISAREWQYSKQACLNRIANSLK